MVVTGRKLALAAAAVALTAAAGVAWVEREGLLAWAYVRGLEKADDAARPRWLARLAVLGEPAIPRLLELLQRDDPAACANARAALDQLAAGWGPGDPRTADLALRLARDFPRMSPPGRAECLAMTAGWLAAAGERTAPAPLAAACGKLATNAAAGDAAPPHLLDLAAALLAGAPTAEALAPCREAVRRCLRAGAAADRVRAVRLALVPGLDLLDDLVPLLADPAREVRRAAMLAVGPVGQGGEPVVRDEALLPSLHDPDAEVRALCEAALRSRGLRPEHLTLGRLLTDPDPVNRLAVLDHLDEASDLDPALWLRRLSHDPSPAVRAAAARAMSQLAGADLTDRLDQMARSDPSPTVAELARYYLRCPRPVAAVLAP